MPIITDDPFTLSYTTSKGYASKNVQEGLNAKERELNLVIVNAMPAGAVLKTPSQFAIPLAAAAGTRKIVINNVSVDGVDYGENADYVKEHYKSIHQLSELEPDGIIVSGSANYDALREAVKKAHEYKGAACKMFSCMSGHAYMDVVHDQVRSKIETGKLHGNFEHSVTNLRHPVTKNMSTLFNQPHSRENDVSWEQFLDAKMKILSYSEQAGVLAASSADGRDLLLQGHIEYTGETLLREFNRDTVRARFNELIAKPANYPPHPKNYLNEHGASFVNKYVERIQNGEFDDKILASNGAMRLPENLEKQIMLVTPNTHASSAHDLMRNWLNLVFSSTHYERGIALDDDLDPNNPFNLDPDEPLMCPYIPQ